MRLIYFLLSFFILMDTAFADNNESFFSKVYFGTEMDMDFLTNSENKNYNLLGNSVKIGYEYSKKLALEINSGSSIFDEDKNRLDSSITLNGKFFHEGYNIDFLNLRKEENRIYGLLGFSSTNISSMDDEKSFTQFSPSIGIGIEYLFSNTLSLYAGYNFLSTDISQAHIGLNYYFSKDKIIDYQEEEIKKLEKDKKIEGEKLVFANMTDEEKIRFEQMLKDEREQNLTLDDRLKSKKEDTLTDDNKTRLDLKLLHKENIKKPILVYLYELSSIEEFKRLDYKETIVLKKGDLSGAVLGQVKLLLEPLKMESFNVVLKDATQYFSVVAAIEDEKDIDEWRWIKKVESHKLSNIKLMLNHKKIMEFK